MCLFAGILTVTIGISLILIGGLNFTIDTYIAMPSLAVGATICVRSAIAFAFPLFGKLKTTLFPPHKQAR